MGVTGGCSGEFAFPAFPKIEVGRKAPTTLAVAQESVVVAGPPGYCIDASASQPEHDSGAFVLLGSCRAISRNRRMAGPNVPGLLTVSVSREAAAAASLAGSLEMLERFFRSEEGRATLSRTGDHSQIEIIETRIEREALFIHARDASGTERGMSSDYWRGLFSVNDRLLTATVLGFQSAPMSDADGLSVLSQLTERIRSKNPQQVEAEG